MTSTDPSRASIRRIKPIVDDVFDQADPSLAYSDCLETDDDICPLFCAISRIKVRYQNPELIGRGGMKEVYRVYDAKAARHVAMAKPLPEYSSDHFDAFLREAHLTARLDHPNIIDLFDMDVDDQGRPFFTMELKQGRSLRQVVRDLNAEEIAKEYPLRKRLEYFLRVCDAVAYAHSRRVLHLDIKPENIFVGEFGEVKVCDWGMGVVMAHQPGQNDSTVLLDPDLYGALLESSSGTPVYMAPEQMNRRQPKTPQMDIYALGCLLQELLACQFSPNAQSSPNARSNSNGVPVSSGVDLALTATIAKATAIDPSSRYQSVEALSEDIHRFLDGFTTSVENPSLRREALLFYKRHRDACSLTLGLLSILAMCVTYFVVQLNRSRDEALEARAVAVEARRISQEAQAEAERSQFQTVTALERAELAQAEAQDSLDLYLAEKNASDRRRGRQVSAATRHSEFVINSALRNGDSMKSAVQTTLEHMDSILVFDPPPKSFAWTQKFWILFLIQDFDSALQLSREGKEITGELLFLAEKYLPLLNEEGYLDTQSLIDLMGELVASNRWRAPLAEKLMIYDDLNQRPVADKVEIVRAWIKINNEEWDAEGLYFDADSATVQLRGAGLKYLRRAFAISERHPNWFSLLHILQPRSLDLRETGIADLNELDGLELFELDIRETEVSDLSPLESSLTLRRVYVAPDQLPESELVGLPPAIEVVVGD
ncbi:serine/threonine-protein kinase [Neorhodopirellula lusitana]|uniref:serine/threonine-protein kinase n=1 Tax=Neorhodopirellula lusitana TaxID=445327 RepID=UPI00384E7ABB